METRRFTGKFKCEAVNLASQAEVSKAKVAEEFGIHATVLTR
jgi:transposase-like protein